MKTIVEKYQIIALKKKGYSNTRIQKELCISRNTIRKYWNEYLSLENELFSLPPDTLVSDITEKMVKAPSYDSSNRKPRKYTPQIHLALLSILESEESKNEILGPHHKQNLTCVQIHELLVKQGFDIGLTTISTKVKEIIDQKKEVFIKQDYEYGERFEYDFGEVKLSIQGQVSRFFIAVITLPASKFRWAYLYRTSKMDVFRDSHVRFFERIQGCPKEGVYDNMRNVVSRFIGKNQKELNDELVQLAMYYGFYVNVTNCFSGNEKGSVESTVKWVRNKVFATRYRFDSFEQAQELLQQELSVLNQSSSIEEEKKHLLPYRPPFEIADIRMEQRVNKYSFVRIDNNDYSVPESLCDKRVTVKLYPNEAVILYKGQLVARHNRLTGKGNYSIKIEHYLDTFYKKPGALKNSAALKSVPALKKIFDRYYSEKPKEFIEILRNNPDSSTEDLINYLIPLRNNLKMNSEDTIRTKTAEQVTSIMELFTGGKRNVH